MKFAVIVFPGSNCDYDAYYVIKKHLKVGISDLDEVNNKTINSRVIKTKVKNISNILKNIKNG